MGLKTIRLDEAREGLEISCDDRTHDSTPRTAWFVCGPQEQNIMLALAAGWTEQRKSKELWFCPDCSQKREASSPPSGS
jgi:hypothetical protein